MLGLSYPFVLQGERARRATPHGCSHNHRPGARATITRQPPLLLNKMPHCPHARICTNTLALLWLRGLYRKHLVVTANTHFRGKLARTANPVPHGKCLFSWQAHLDHKCWFQPQIAILWPRGYLVANGLSRGTNGHAANRVLLANARPCGSNGGAAIGVPWQSGGPATRTNLWQTMAHGN